MIYPERRSSAILCSFILWSTLMMIFQNYIYRRLKIPQKAEQYRPKGSAKETSLEMQFEYLHYTTPRKTMSEMKREKLLNKIGRLAHWLDNAVPSSPIPLGLDSVLVSRRVKFHVMQKERASKVETFFSMQSFIPFIGGFAGSLFTLYQGQVYAMLWHFLLFSLKIFLILWYIVYLSTLFGIPLWLLLRMLINLVIGKENKHRTMFCLLILFIDLALGSIPIIGGFIDIFYKANLWNYEALVDYLEHEKLQDTTTTTSTASTSTASSSTTTLETEPYYRRSIGEKSWLQLAGDLRHFSVSALSHLPSSQDIKTKIK